MRGPSDQPQRQLTPIAIFVPFDKIRNRERKLAHLKIAASAQFAGDIFGDIFRPALGSIEGDDADRIAILPGQQTLNYRFEVGGFVIGFAPGAAQSTEIIRHQVNRFIVVVRNYRRRPTRPTHYEFHAMRN
jgi:hypothetical protein